MNSSINNFFNRYHNCSQKELNKAVMEATQKGALKEVQYLLSSPELKKHPKIKKGDILWEACSSGHVNIVKYLMTLTNNKGELLVDVEQVNIGFVFACSYGNQAIVEYFLKKSVFKEEIQINKRRGLAYACESGCLNLVKYLLTHTYSAEKADVHAHSDDAFKTACHHNRTDIIKFLLSLSDDQYINFQKLESNLEWAMKEKKMKIIEAMMLSLKKNDLMEYLDYLPIIKQYCFIHNQDDMYVNIIEHHIDDNNSHLYECDLQI